MVGVSMSYTLTSHRALLLHWFPHPGCMRTDHKFMGVVVEGLPRDDTSIQFVLLYISPVCFLPLHCL